MRALQSLRAKIDILVLLVVLPPVGIGISGKSIRDYLEFPPLTRHVGHAEFSWIAFGLLAALIVGVVAPFVIRCLSSQNRIPASHRRGCYGFPWWGWAGLALAAAAWILAWNRFAWFAPLQPFTFSPLWFGYIIVINALTRRRKGECMMTSRPGYFFTLFFISAGFWWFFEYLNRFVQNWYYVGIADLTPLQYVIFATLPFSTVLPAVLGTYELLATLPRLSAGLDDFVKIRVPHPKVVAWAAILAFCLGLAGIGASPDYLFPLLWVSPLFIITSFQAIRGEETIFGPVARGDWRRVVLLALSALICGFFWEMWNFNSLAKWKYMVPFVNRFQIFEMPLLGYAGYLPFGLECAVIAGFFMSAGERRPAPAAQDPRIGRVALANIAAWGNAIVLAILALYFFIAPGFIVMRDLSDPALRGPEIPRIAWRLHRDLTRRYEGYARARVASGRAAHLHLRDVPSTEWPMFGSVYYLWATEALQAAWENDHSLAPEAPKVYARRTIEAAVDLIVDPVHHTWVKQHWGENYMHRENVFFRTLIIAGLTGHEKLIGDGRHRALLRDQVDTLAAELDASPHGVLEDYPFECYPIDVFAAIACIQRADRVLGTDHRAFIARSIRGFQGKMLDERGLIPYTMDSKRGRLEDPSRGTGMSYVLIFARELWPEVARDWYRRYEEHFWQDSGWAAGFREYPRDLPQLDWGFDVDAGVILAGFSPAANAFGVAATKVNGRLDQAWTLTSQVLAACWPLPDGTLLGPRLISTATGGSHAPYLGETCMLFFLAQSTAPGMEMRTGGHKPGCVYIGYAFYFGVGLLVFAGGLWKIIRWRRERSRCVIPAQGLQFGAWVVLLLGGVVAGAAGWTCSGLLAVLAAQLLPRVEKVNGATPES